MLSKRMGEWRRSVAAIVNALRSPQSSEIIRAVFALSVPAPVFSEGSRAIPYYWKEAELKPSTNSVELRLLFDVVITAAQSEVMRAPFSAASADELMAGATDDGRPPGELMKFYKELDNFWGRTAIGGVTIATVAVGNLPGPPSLWVLIAQHRALAAVKRAAAGDDPSKALVATLVTLSAKFEASGKGGLSPDAIEKIRAGLTSSSKEAVRGAHERIREWVGENTHSSVQMNKVITVFSLFLFAASLSKLSTTSTDPGLQDYVAFVMPIVSGGINVGAGAATLAAQAAVAPAKAVAVFKAIATKLGAAASVMVVGSLVSAGVALYYLPSHTSAIDTFFAWVDVASAGLGAGWLILGMFGCVIGAKVFAVGAVVGIVAAGAKIVLDATNTGTTNVILKRINAVAGDEALKELTGDLSADYKAILDLDTANRWRFGKNLKRLDPLVRRLKNDVMLDDGEIKEIFGE
jgi:hypothetical protein